MRNLPHGRYRETPGLYVGKVEKFFLEKAIFFREKKSKRTSKNEKSSFLRFLAETFYLSLQAHFMMFLKL